MAKRFLSVINLPKLASDPASGSEGDLYYNTTSDTLRYHNGSIWQGVSGGGGDSLPSQTGNSGEFLTTNGTTASWAPIDKTTVGLGNVENTALSTWSGSSNITTVGTLANLTVTNTITGSISGNAGTVTNGVYTSGSYSNPSWLTALSWSKISSTPTTISGYGITDAQPIDADLTAIAGLTGTSGFLKKTAADTWTLDTSTYLTTSNASSTYAPLASPALTGTPTAPTASVDTNTTQIATTAFVVGQGYLKSANASSTYATKEELDNITVLQWMGI